MSSRIQDGSTRQFNKNKGKNGGNPGGAGTGSWKRTFTNGDSQDEDRELDENEQCVICAERIDIAAKSPCSHTTCHKCTFRQRALYGKKACLICRTENDKLIFTEDLTKDYSQFKVDSFVKFNEKYGIEFTSQHVHDATLSLLEYRCQICNDVSKDFKSLSSHLKTEHERTICNICSENKKAFPFELKIYTAKQLQTHQMRGDDKGFHGHPLCKFCKGLRFYSDDELKIHLRQNHERCHVCDRIDPSNPQYFKNYDALEEHFRHDHFICNVQVCLDKKFVVFEDELDLQAHMLQEHGGVYGKNYVVGASSHNNRYHSQLSTFRSINNNSTSNRNNPNSALSEKNTDSIETRKMRFEERARHYLNYQTAPFKTFLELNNSYKNNKIDAIELEQSYRSLFKDNNENDINLLIYDLSEIYPKNSVQGKELAKIVAMHEQKTKELNDFPALPGSSTSLNAFGSSSWKNNSKKSNNKQRLDEDFPALPTGKTSTPGYAPVKTTVRYKTVIHQKPSSKPTTVKINQTKSTYIPNYLSASSSASSSSTSLSTTSKPAINEDLFPALPKPPPKKVIPRVNPVPSGNGAWDVGSSSSSNSTMNLSSLDESLPVLGKGKGKKKKQILFQLGGK